MKQTEPCVVLKYCAPIDEFVKIRIFTEEEGQILLRHARIDGRDGYQKLIVNACIVRYHEEVLPSARRKHPSLALDEVLFPYCIEVNPHLDLARVAIPVRPADGNEKIHIMPTPERGADDRARARLRNLEGRLAERVVGQGEAVRVVVEAIRRAAVGIRNPERPIGAFLFVGPTGVGKTELAKALATLLFDDPAKLVRIDCSEFALPHEYAKLIGAPPGYIGHDEGGMLTEAIKREKEAVVLFDEVEKADAKMHHLLLQILDEGALTDGKGSKVSFQDTIVLMTGNLGTREVEGLSSRIGFASRPGAVGAAERRREIHKSVRKRFRPEFVNRVDRVVVFEPLGPTEAERIVSLQVAQVAAYARGSGLRLEIGQGVEAHLARIGFSERYGARELRRTVEREVANVLAQKVLEGEFRSGDTVAVTCRRDSLHFARKRAKAAKAKVA
ncbi:MAG: ATP-dependent Clp protease ATP-binding subunit [Planctomycetes bacterium]|nr:ATP-dependent Clp protease ATP-binding subunit [Planctomycetota bacterium]